MNKNWDNLFITDQFNITGRGLILVVDFVLSGLCTELWEAKLPKIEAGDTILYEHKVYVIKSVEFSKNTLNGYLMTRVGLLVV